MVPLSKGSIVQIHEGAAVGAPVLQLLSIQKVPSAAAGGLDRYRRVAWSTSIPLAHPSTGASARMARRTRKACSTSLNDFAESGGFERLVVFRLDNHACNQIQDKK
jgi:hypothetical protein